jgi:hypothetical protein
MRKAQELKLIKKMAQRFDQRHYFYKQEGSVHKRQGLLKFLIKLKLDASKTFHKQPKKVIILLTDSSKEIFKKKFGIKRFFFDHEVPTRDEVIVRVKSLFSLLRLTGDPKIDFCKKSFKTAYKRSKIPDASSSSDSSTEDEQGNKKDKGKKMKYHETPKKIDENLKKELERQVD